MPLCGCGLRLEQLGIGINVFQGTYCLLQLACSTILISYVPRRGVTEYLVVAVTCAGLLQVLLPHVLPQRRGGARASRGNLFSSVMLSALFALCAAALVSDAHGSCAISAGHLPAAKFGLPVDLPAAPKVPAKLQPKAQLKAAPQQEMGAAPWGLCISLDLAIAAALVNVVLYAAAAVISVLSMRAAAARGRPPLPVVGTPVGPPQPARRRPADGDADGRDQWVEIQLGEVEGVPVDPAAIAAAAAAAATAAAAKTPRAAAAAARAAAGGGAPAPPGSVARGTAVVYAEAEAAAAAAEEGESYGQQEAADSTQTAPSPDVMPPRDV